MKKIWTDFSWQVSKVGVGTIFPNELVNKCFVLGCIQLCRAVHPGAFIRIGLFYRPCRSFFYNTLLSAAQVFCHCRGHGGGWKRNWSMLRDGCFRGCHCSTAWLGRASAELFSRQPYKSVSLCSGGGHAATWSFVSSQPARSRRSVTEYGKQRKHTEKTQWESECFKRRCRVCKMDLYKDAGHGDV